MVVEIVVKSVVMFDDYLVLSWYLMGDMFIVVDIIFGIGYEFV